MRAGDRGADTLGVGDNGLALAAETVDKRADARGVLRIGALDLVHFGVDEGFEFDRARQRAFDAFAHGGNFAADSLADHHDAVLRQVFRLGKAERHFGHRLRGNAHFLRAAHHHREGEDQDDREQGAEREHHPFGVRKKLVEGISLPDNGTEKAVCKEGASAEPQCGQDRRNPVDGPGRALVQAMQQRAEILLAVVVCRSKGRRLVGGWPLNRPIQGAVYRAVDRTLGGPGWLPCGGLLAVAALAHQLVRGLGNLRFQVVHGCGHVVGRGIPIRSRSSAVSSSLETSLSIDLVVVGFFAMPPLPFTQGAQTPRTGTI